MNIEQHNAPRYATEDELEELRQCEIKYADMGAVFDELNEEDWNAYNKPIISLVFDGPDMCTKIAGKEYRKLLLAIWSSTFYMLYGWKDGAFDALPPDTEYLEQYIS